MPVDKTTIGWFSPDPRGVILPSAFHVSRSLKKSARRFRTTSNEAFGQVLDECAHPRRPNGWIDTNIKDAYLELHRLGWAHSVEVWDDQGLAGGVYGIAIGSFFAGESMFHRRTDASKVALLHLTNRLKTRRESLLDVQWLTPHLQRLGGQELPRTTYSQLLQEAIDAPPIFDESDRTHTQR